MPDLESDTRSLLDPKRNPAFEFSAIQPFVVYCGGSAVGRIVGIINRKANERWQTRNVRFALIEFVDDRRVSAALLQAVAEWGRSLGMVPLAHLRQRAAPRPEESVEPQRAADDARGGPVCLHGHRAGS